MVPSGNFSLPKFPSQSSLTLPQGLLAYAKGLEENIKGGILNIKHLLSTGGWGSMGRHGGKRGEDKGLLSRHVPFSGCPKSSKQGLIGGTAGEPEGGVAGGGDLDPDAQRECRAFVHRQSDGWLLAVPGGR